MEGSASAAWTGRQIVAGSGAGPVLACETGLSFWGGVDPDSGRIIDAHHPLRGQDLAGRVLVMPGSRGSCSGSGVLLALALSGRAPAALIFREAEETLTLGALVAGHVFGRPLPVVRLGAAAHARAAQADRLAVAEGRLTGPGISVPLHADSPESLQLTAEERALLQGAAGPPVALAMEVLCRMAIAQDALRLIAVRRGHIDGCILAHDANLIFAERMAGMGARVAVPTTINAISVDRAHWHAQGVPRDFGLRASRLADACVRMGAQPTFTCAPYLLDDPPGPGEPIGWSESNAVIHANSVLGARTAKHPDYMDLFVAMTGRAPLTGIHTDAGRAPRRIIAVTAPAGIDDAFWPLLGWLAGRLSPDRVPLLTGLESLAPGPDDLKALCAGFGTTSGAPMLHVAGHTPEAGLPPAPDADHCAIGPEALAAAWAELDGGARRIDLVAIGSPHASLQECRRLDALLAGRRRHRATEVIVTLGRGVLAAARAEGLAARLARAGVRLIPDLCWCSITEPVFPPAARSVMTNSAKYAHYGPALTGRAIRFGGLAACAEAALSGLAPPGPPAWLRPGGG
ncbi:MAG: hypothetical protein KatS3mg118_2909 [Paracoccaceae bacterium]|nr:MAG: hypothetical protein KatS3mg118_2909 [Paracoccaceae bacterium]